MTVEFSLAYFVAVFVFLITPGPGVFALIAKALKQGGNACWGLAIGMTMSDIIYLLLVVWRSLLILPRLADMARPYCIKWERCR